MSNIAIGIALLIVVVLVAALMFYFFLPSKPEPVKKTARPKPEPPAPTRYQPPPFTVRPDGGVDIPEEIPRTIETVKIIAEERVELIVPVVKTWLREDNKREADIGKLGQILDAMEKQPKRYIKKT